MNVEILRYAAFTRDGEGGNPAGVVLGAHRLTDEQMLSIAQDLGYSESAFVLRDPADSPDIGLRYFSPQAEVAFCGHATVATAVALADRQGPRELQFTTMAGPVPVTTEAGAGGTRATLTSPPARSEPLAEDLLERLLEALRWSRGDLDPAYPVHVGFAGNHHPVVAVRDEATLAGLDYDYPALSELMRERSWTTVHTFWAQDRTTFQVRNPFPPGGVVEDPATGAAAAAFGGYLRSIGVVSPPVRLTLLQGHHMGAPSLLLVDLDPDSEAVRVTGTASIVAPS